MNNLIAYDDVVLLKKNPISSNGIYTDFSRFYNFDACSATFEDLDILEKMIKQLTQSE